tara:strand:+ start:3402 stop:3569 length:168 start_codon:yes stop_codon:yes gene_type:complete
MVDLGQKGEHSFTFFILNSRALKRVLVIYYNPILLVKSKIAVDQHFNIKPKITFF